MSMRLMLAMLLCGLSVIGCGGSSPSGPGSDGGQLGDGALSDAWSMDATLDDAGAQDLGAADAGNPVAVFSTEMVDFGANDCGGSAPSNQVVTLTNNGDIPLTYTASISASAQFSVDANGATGSIAPGDHATISVLAAAVPTTATAGVQLTGTLVVMTNDPTRANVMIPVWMLPSGATLTLTQSTVDFGMQPFGIAASPLPISLTNTGSAPATVTFGTPDNADYGITYTDSPSAVTLAPGDSVSGLAATYTPSGTDASMSAAAISVTGAVCGMSATSIGLSGQGTRGVVVVAGDMTFGAVNCGTSAMQQTLMLGNQGNATYEYTAVLGQGDSSPYTITSGAIGHADPMQNTPVVITPKPIPVPSPVPGNYNDTLTITTNIPGDVAHVVNLSESAQGALLAFDTASIPFGDVPVATQQNATFNLINSGNLSANATLTIASSSNAFTISPTTQAAVAGASQLAGNVTFAPTDTTSPTATVNVTVTPDTVLCAALPSGISISGNGQNGGVSLSANSLSFGPTNCGATAPPQALTLTNSGNTAMTWSMALGLDSSPFSAVAVPPAGTLAAGDSTTITITPASIPSVASTAANAFGDALTITTDVVGDAPHVVTLNQTAQGAVLAFQPNDVNLGFVPVHTNSTGNFSVVNTGNLPAHVTLTSSSGPFTFPGTAFPTVVGTATPTTVTAQFAPGADTSTQSAIGTMTVDNADVLCSPLPAPLTLEGTGTNGTVAYSPSSLNFQNVNCGTTAAPQVITFTNVGNQPYTISAALGASSSPYSFAISPPSGVVTANGGTATITVSPHAIPVPSEAPGNYGDVLTVTTTAAGDSPHDILLSENAYGAILNIAPTSLAFPATRGGRTSVYQLVVGNTGNAPATVVFTSIEPPPAPSGIGPFDFQQNVVVSGGATIFPNATFTPTAAISYSGTAALGVAGGTVLCAPLPGQMLTMTGRGTSALPPVTVTPTTVNFGNVNCGTAAHDNTAVRITNNTNASITATLTLANTNGMNYTATLPNAGVIAANTTATVTISPNAIPVAPTTTVAGNHFGDTLTITTTAVGDHAHTVQIHETAQGAILIFNRTTTHVRSAAGSHTTFKVENLGNISASFALVPSITTSAPYSITPLIGVINARGSGGLIGTTFDVTRTSSPAMPETVSLMVPTDLVLCQPLPADENIVSP